MSGSFGESFQTVGASKHPLTVFIESFLKIWIFSLKRGGVEVTTEFITLSGQLSILAAYFTLPHSCIYSIIANNG